MSKLINKTVSFYSDGTSKTEKAVSLEEWIENNEIVPGMFVLLANLDIDEVNDANTHTIYESFYVGDCTPYIEPTDNDGCIGWDYDHPRMRKWVVEVHYPQFKSMPNFGDYDYDED